MANETVYVVLPFAKVRGRIKAMAMERVKTSAEAERRAKRMALARGGAIVARTDGTDIGDLGHADITAKFGEVPDNLEGFLL